MRVDSNPAWAHPVEYRDSKRCKRTIKLGDATYRCSRTDHIDGIHDANARHADGGLVRW